MTYHILFTLFPILTVLVLPFRQYSRTNDCPLTTFFFINGLTSRFTYTVNEYMHILLQSREQLYTVILFVNPKLSEHQIDSENDRTTPII